MARHGIRAEADSAKVPAGIDSDCPARPKGEVGRRYWDYLLSLPEAELWSKGDGLLVGNLARALARAEQYNTPQDFAQVAGITDRLGLNPRARARLGVLAEEPRSEPAVPADAMEQRRAQLLRLAAEEHAS
jgi:hypothetical protein